MTWPTWEQLKQGGSDHYHRGEIQPIDLYKTHPEAFHHWAVIESMQHLWRNIEPSGRIEDDMGKVIHYCRMVMANHKEQGGA